MNNSNGFRNSLRIGKNSNRILDNLERNSYDERELNRLAREYNIFTYAGQDPYELYKLIKNAMNGDYISNIHIYHKIFDNYDENSLWDLSYYEDIPSDDLTKTQFINLLIKKYIPSEYWVDI